MLLGVTGGVGSGKSTVLKILKEKYGAHLLIADDIAKELMMPGNESYRLIVSGFGRGILEDPSASDSPILRSQLARIVFSDEEKLRMLNSFTHPAVKREIMRRAEIIYSEDPHALIVIEAALLIESGYTDMLDWLWVVTADKKVRLRRLARERGYTKEKAESVMANQLSDEEFTACADFVIDNSGDIKDTEEIIAEGMSRLFK